MKIPRSQVLKHTGDDSSYIPLAIRREVLKEQGKTCHFCEDPTEYLCHDLPKCRGGTTEKRNLLVCCKPCRQDKGELTAVEYRKLREGNLDELWGKPVRVRIFFRDPLRDPLEGEVDRLPDLNAKGFYLKDPEKETNQVIYTEPGMRIIELQGGGK